MALRISEQNGIITLKGDLTSKTSKALSQYLESLKDLKQEVKINVEYLKQVDFSGQLTLKKLRESNHLI